MWLLEEEDELPLIGQKMSNNLLDFFNELFDKFQQSFRLLSAKQVLTESCPPSRIKPLDHEQRIHAVETSVTELQQGNKNLRAKLCDLESRSRCQNIKIVGIPEGEENGSPTEFVSNLIPKLLRDYNFTKPVVTNRAHRTQQPKPSEGSHPRTIIARVHLAQEKENILRLGRRQSMEYPALYTGSRRSASPQRQHKEKIWENMEYIFTFTATLTYLASSVDVVYYSVHLFVFLVGLQLTTILIVYIDYWNDYSTNRIMNDINSQLLLFSLFSF